MSKKVIILVIVGLLAVAGTMAGTLFLAKEFLIKPDAVHPAAAAAAPATAAKDPVYESIEPAFVVNILDGNRYRYLQVQVDVMTRDAAVMPRFEKYLPRIKGELNMLFSAITSEQAHTSEGRLDLQKNTLDTINRILTEESGKAGIEAVYFSKFVVQ